MKCLYCYNKIDQISIEDVDMIARIPNTVVISCENDLNLDYFIEQMWKKLDSIRAYTKKKGEFPDFPGGLILRNGTTVGGVCQIHTRL